MEVGVKRSIRREMLIRFSEDIETEQLGYVGKSEPSLFKA